MWVNSGQVTTVGLPMEVVKPFIGLATLDLELLSGMFGSRGRGCRGSPPPPRRRRAGSSTRGS